MARGDVLYMFVWLYIYLRKPTGKNERTYVHEKAINYYYYYYYYYDDEDNGKYMGTQSWQ